MLQKITILLTTLFLVSCSPDDSLRQRNPFILDISFSIILNTNLPQYSSLQFPGNAVYVPNAGNRGIFVINTGSGARAWEATDPNHTPNDCSTMQLNGVEVICPCEQNTYNLYTGLARDEVKPYPLLEYRAAQNRNEILVSN